MSSLDCQAFGSGDDYERTRDGVCVWLAISLQLAAAASASSQVVSIPDAALEASVRESLGIAERDITREDMLRLIQLRVV